MIDRPDGCAAIQRDLNRLEKWASRNFVRFHKGKCQIMPLGSNNPSHQNRLEAEHLQSRFAEKVVEGPGGHQIGRVPAMCSCGSVLGCLRQGVAADQGR